MVKCIFTTKATAQQYRIEPNGSVFNSLAPANGYAQKNCAERFSALNSAVCRGTKETQRASGGSSFKGRGGGYIKVTGVIVVNFEKKS